MKPARSPMVTSTLPSRSASASTSSTTSGSVTTVRTTSTSFMTGAGLKKCMPMTLLGRPVATEISVTDRLEVLVARIVSGGQILSSSAKTSRLELHALGHGLDRPARPGRGRPATVLKRIRSRMASRSAAVELAAGDRPVGGVLDVARPRARRRLVDLDGGHRQAGAGEHLDDAGTHGAQPDDADLVQFPGHAAISSAVRSRDPQRALTPRRRSQPTR